MNSMNLIIPTPFSGPIDLGCGGERRQDGQCHCDFSTLHTTRNDGRMLSALPPHSRAMQWNGQASAKMARLAATWVPASGRHASPNEREKYTRVSLRTARTFGASLMRRSHEPR